MKVSKVRKILVSSFIMILFSVLTFTFTTFAWFSDSVTSKQNIISVGNLDVEMYWTDNLSSDEWHNIEDPIYNEVFSNENYEPGYTDVKYLKVVNAGSLAFKYDLRLLSLGEVGELAEVVDVYYLGNVTTNIAYRDLGSMNKKGTIKDTLGNTLSGERVLLPKNSTNTVYPTYETVVAVALKMQESAGNEYQGKSIGDGFSIKLIATQFSLEEDSFGNDYDNGATLPVTATVGIQTNNNKVSQAVSISTESIEAVIPAGVKVNPGTNALTLSVSEMSNTQSNIHLEDDETLTSLDVHIEGVSDNNKVAMLISINGVADKFLNQGNISLFHVEDGITYEMKEVENASDLVNHNEFYYNSSNGTLIVALASFSEVGIIQSGLKAWNGNYDHSWYTNKPENQDYYTIYNADQLNSFAQIVGGMAEGIELDDFEGKTVKLIADINIGDMDSENDFVFYPIGYYNNLKSFEKQSGKFTIDGVENTALYSSVSSFEGTFDGNGHTISNFYQNTWEMFGDYNDGYSGTPNHYKDGMGLFGYVYNGTVKNLRIENFSSDGEFTPTGVVAAYACNATFENIAIVNSNPRVYNTGNGGIVGIAGNSDDETDKTILFKNITVDNTNKISALWGSWDVACGGIAGMYRGDSKIMFNNCHVAAQIDVNNDVCANYQYYAYRYSGMLIGSVRKNVTINGHEYPKLTNVYAESTTVHFGEWNNYYYCELVANSLASYTHDHQFSRLTEVDSIDVNNMKVTIDGVISSIPTSGRYNYVVVSGGHDTDHATCYHFVNGEQWTHDKAGKEPVSGQEVLKEDKQHIYLPFNQLFTGYGWGVTSKSVNDVNEDPTLNGQVTAGQIQVSILDKLDGSPIQKFTAKDISEKTYQPGATIYLGDLFEAAKDIGENEISQIHPEMIQVGVTYVDYSGATRNVDATLSKLGEDWTKYHFTLPEGIFGHQGNGEVYVTIQDYVYCSITRVNINLDVEEKFESKFTNENFIYRVGNLNTVALGSLISVKEGKDIIDSEISITSKTISGNANLSYTAADDWKNIQIQFNGTGVIEFTISEPTSKSVSMKLEVIDAVNATSTTNIDAIANNVVLLKDITAINGGVEVSNGYTLYGNGFKLNCPGNGSYRSAALSYGFVTVSKGGVLDNIQVICDIFPVSYMYTSEMKAGDDGRYPYGYSAVVISDDSKITNSYIYGARNNILVTDGNVTISNTVVECGSVANIQIKTTEGYNITLEDVTTIQYPVKSNYDSSKTVLGFGVVVGDKESDSNPTVVLKGEFKQYNWVNSSTTTSNTYAQTAITQALKVSEYQHNIDGVTAVNMGIAVLNSKTFNVLDLRTNTDIKYGLNEITMLSESGQVYSILSGSPITKENGYDPVTDKVTPYIPTQNGDTLLDLSYSGKDGVSFIYEFDSNTSSWVARLTVDLDVLGTYNFASTNLFVSEFGKQLDFRILNSNGEEVNDLKLENLFSGVYIIEIPYNYKHDVNGETVVDSNETLIPLYVIATKTSIPDPLLTFNGGAVAIRLVEKSGGDWRPAYPVFTGVVATYWDASLKKEVTLDLSSANIYNQGSIVANTWTYTNDQYTLTITGGQVHSDGSKITPVVSNNTLYFASTNKAFTTGTTSRSIILTYTLSVNGIGVTYNKNYTVNYSDLSEYSYSSFKNGTLEAPSSGGTGCVTPDTLITLADGSQVRVDSLTGNEELLVWNLETGKLDSAPIMFVDSEEMMEYEVVYLHFSDGSKVGVIYEHGFWDYNLNKYVYLDENASEYIGHWFAKQNGEQLEKVQLVNVEIIKEFSTAWSPVTVGHLCYFVNGMLSMPGGISGLFNIFEVNSNTMTYDYEAMERDILTYGLYTYEELNAICPLSREMFEAAGGAYLKVSLGKGNMTIEDLIYMINRYSNYI